MEQLLAKSNGITLEDHLKIVTKVGNFLARNLFGNNKELIDKTTIACAFHDLGKCYTNFQEYIKNHKDINNLDELEGCDFKTQNKITNLDILQHNNISWAWLSNNIRLNYRYQDDVLGSVLYHHPLTDYNVGKTSQEIIELLDDLTISNINNVFDIIHTHLKNEYSIESIILQENENYFQQPSYYTITKQKEVVGGINENTLAIKSCLIAADRFCSRHTNDELITFMNNGELNDEHLATIFNELWDISNNCEMIAPSNFDLERFKTQKRYALEAATNESNVTIIKAPAGFGKTITGLLWASKLNKKTLWVCPINTIATATYESIKEEINTFKLNLKIELLLSNEIKDSNFEREKYDKADITITNIDNFLKPTINNEKAELNYDLVNYSVIFDEFHDLDSDSAIFAGFINILRTRMHLCPNSKTLLLSATPEKLNILWDTNEKHKTHIIKAKPLNNMDGKYRINFKTNLELNTNMKDTLYMFNSVSFAQNLFIDNRDKFSYLIHSSYIDSDKEKIRKDITSVHGKHMKYNLDERSKYNVIGTRIIGTGLDISFGELHENVTSPELTLQSIGRINRYGEITDRVIDLYLYRLDEKSEDSAICINYKTKLSNMWYNFLKENFENGQVITLQELYDVYDKFYENDEFRSEYIKLIRDEKLVISKENYAKLIPKKYFYKPKLKTDKITIQKNSLRSTNKDVKFVICRYKDTEEFITPMQLETVRFEDHDSLFGTEMGRTDYIAKLQPKGLYDFDLKRMMGKKTNRLSTKQMMELAINNNSPYILLGFEYDENVGLMKKYH